MASGISPAVVQVLIVDDQEPFRTAARMVVELTEGFEVIGEAPSGEDALGLAADLHPDLILMDINLPGMDGLETTRQLTSRYPQMKVIVMSTYEPDEYEDSALAAGAVAFLPKSDLAPETLSECWNE